MNPQVRQLLRRPCIVCGYPYSDKHHIAPRRDKYHVGPHVMLCPNHHRFANIVQIMIERGMDDEAIWKFAAEEFDPTFNERILARLIRAQRHETQSALSVADIFWIFEDMFGGPADEDADPNNLPE